MIEVSIQKDLGGFHLDVQFTAGNQVLALLGGSGSGKSMTLRCIAGVENPDAGRIVVDGVTFYDSARHINLTPRQRQVGLLFQNYALFPTMTVRQNILTGVRSGSKAERRAAVEEALTRYQLSGLGDRYPAELSGGQQQRAALARILVGKPRILMLDEPFSALDSHLRDRMEREVLALLQDFGGTTLLVSHSRDEVFRMADQVAVYVGGRIDALGEKHAVFRNPGTYHAALLTGCKNFSRAERCSRVQGRTRLYAADWDLELMVDGTEPGTVIAIRGHHIRLSEEAEENSYEMEIAQVIEDTFEYVYLLRRPGTQARLIHWMVPKTGAALATGTRVTVAFPQGALMLLRD